MAIPTQCISCTVDTYDIRPAQKLIVIMNTFEKAFTSCVGHLSLTAEGHEHSAAFRSQQRCSTWSRRRLPGSPSCLPSWGRWPRMLSALQQRVQLSTPVRLLSWKIGASKLCIRWAINTKMKQR